MVFKIISHGTRAIFLFVSVRLSSRKNLRSACLIVRISSRFSGPLISTGKFQFVLNYFFPRCATRLAFSCVSIVTSTTTTRRERRANEPEHPTFDIAVSCGDFRHDFLHISYVYRTNRIIGANCQSKTRRGLFVWHVDASLRL